MFLTQKPGLITFYHCSDEVSFLRSPVILMVLVKDSNLSLPQQSPELCQQDGQPQNQVVPRDDTEENICL